MITVEEKNKIKAFDMLKKACDIELKNVKNRYVNKYFLIVNGCIYLINEEEYELLKEVFKYE